MPRVTPERIAQIRKDCFGRAMINANVLYDLFDEIRELEREKKILSDLLFKKEKRLRDFSDTPFDPL
jgi:hypothetical protein